MWRSKRGYEAAPDFLAHTLSLRPHNPSGLVSSAKSVEAAERLSTLAAAGAERAEAMQRPAVGSVMGSGVESSVELCDVGVSVDDDFPAASPGIGADSGWVLGKVKNSWGISVQKSLWLLNSNGGDEGGGGGGRPGKSPRGASRKCGRCGGTDGEAGACSCHEPLMA